MKIYFYILYDLNSLKRLIMKLGFGKYKDQCVENVYLRDPQYIIKTMSCSPMKNDSDALQYMQTKILQKPNRHLMDYNRIIKTLKSYIDQPEIIMFDVLKGLLSNDVIDVATYDNYKKRWNKIKNYAEDEINPTATFYQDFAFDLERTTSYNLKWSYEIGRFALPKNNYAVVSLSCMGHFTTKIINITIIPQIIPSPKMYVSGTSNETRLTIENDTTMNFCIIKKCIKICETLNLLNSCKKCGKIVIFNKDYELCSECLNIAAKKIQDQWRQCFGIQII